MVDVAALNVSINADTSGLDRGLAEANTKVGGFGSSMAGVLGTAAVAGGVAIAAGLAVGVKAAGDLQQSVANISTIKPEIDTSAVFGALNEMSTRIPQSAAELGSALYDVFSSVNVTSEEGLTLVEAFAKGAIGASTDAQTFGTAAMGVMNAYGLSVADAGHISDVFFNTIAAGVVTGPELAASLGPVTQSAKAAGDSLDELGAMIVGVTKEGGPAAQNINNLNNLLQKVTTKEAQLQMNKLGVATTTATGEFKPTIEVMRALKERLADMTESARAAALQSIFPDAQARIGAQTIMSQIDAVDAALETNRTAVGSTEAAYAKMSATFNSQSKLAINALMSIGTAIGAELLPLITPLITAFAQGLPRAFELAKVALDDFAQIFSGADMQIELAELLSNIGLEGLAPAIHAVVRKAGDAWRTLGEILSGSDWAPDESIDPFVDAVGRITVAVKSVVDAVGPYLTELGAIIRTALSGDITGALTDFQTLLRDMATQFGPIFATWGQQFVTWVAPMIPPMLAALADLGLQLLAWIAAQIPPLVAQLLLWGQEFVAWVAPQIPPLLAAAGLLGTALLTWVAAQIPLIVAQLVLWGQEFVAWVAPQIPPMLAALGALLVALTGWAVGTALPAITAELVKWGAAFIAWVAPAEIGVMEGLGKLLASLVAWQITVTAEIARGVVAWATELGKTGPTAIPEMLAGLATFGVAIQTWMLTLGPRMLQWGVEAIGSFIKGFLSVPIPMPSFGGGGGGGGGGSGASQTPTPLSYQATTSGGFANNAERLAFVRSVAAEMGHNPETVARGAMMEGAGAAGPVGDNGMSFGALQAYTGGGMGNTFQQTMGLDPRDPNNERALVRWQIEQLRNTGWQPYNGPVKRGGFGQWEGINTGARPQTGQEMPRISLSGGSGGDPSRWPGYMHQVVEAAPGYLATLQMVNRDGIMVFESVAAAGTTAGANLVSASTDSLGNVTRIYSDATGVIGATITSASGAIVNSWGSMAVAVGATNTQLGTRLISETTNAAGITVAKYAETSGAIVTIVTGQNGKVLADFTMAASEIGLVTDTLHTKLLNSTANNLGGVTEVYREKTGEIVTIVTDSSGKIVQEFTTVAAAVTAEATTMTTNVAALNNQMGTRLIEETTIANGIMLAKYQEQSGAIVTIVTGQNGQVLADFTLAAEQIGLVTDLLHTTYLTSTTDALGMTTEIWREKTGEITTIVTDSSGKIVEEFTSVGKAAVGTALPLSQYKTNIENIPELNLKSSVSELNAMARAADKATQAIIDLVEASEDLPGSGGGSSSSKGKGADRRAVGGPVIGGQMYMVGEQGPEMFYAPSSGNIVPNHRLGGGGDTTIVNVTVNVPGILTHENDLTRAIGDEVGKHLREGGSFGGSR